MSEKKYKNKNWLHNQYWNKKLSMVDIAKKCNVVKGTIYVWLKKYNIITRTNKEAQQLKTGEKKYRNKDWLYDQYWNKKKSSFEIAKERNVSSSVVRKWMKKFNIPRRSASEASLNYYKNDKPTYKSKKWLFEQYINKEKSIRKISEEIKISRGVIKKRLESFGIKIRSKGFGKGKFHSRWKGGKFTSSGGYIKIYKPKHPNSNDGYIFEHVFNMSEFLKRPIKDEERIHHIDGVKNNNSIENLALCTIKTHGKIHYSLVNCGYELYKSDVIQFDREKKRYYVNKK